MRQSLSLLLFFIGVRVLIACSTLDEVSYTYEPKENAEGFIATIERGSLKSDGSEDASMNSYEQWIRSAYYIDIKDAETVYIPSTRAGLCYLWQYDKDHKLISCNEMDTILFLCNNCKYIRFNIRASNTPSSISLLLTVVKKIRRNVSVCR